MEGKQFSTSRGYVIYIRDVLDRYGPDAIRYYICAAGPENQDANFTWAEFVQRNNSELVAGWGNLVNRTAAMVAQELRRDPGSRARSSRSTRRCGPRSWRRSRSSGACWPSSGSRRPSPRRCAPSARSTSTSPTPSRSSSRARTSASAWRPCCTRSPSAWPTSTGSWRRSCRRRPTRCTRPSAARATFMPMPVLEEVAGLDAEDADRSYPIVTGEYSQTPAGSPSRCGSGPLWSSPHPSSRSSTSRSSRRSSPGSGTTTRRHW